MAIEIERKFLVETDDWRRGVESQVRLVQGYLANHQTATVRVRIKGQQAFLTIKGATHGISRAEFEYPIPVADAEVLLRDLTVSPPIEKNRYQVRYRSDLWDIDVFSGANAGLVLAEIELETADQVVDLPPWLGNEVSHDSRYYNVNLARHPYHHW